MPVVERLVEEAKRDIESDKAEIHSWKKRIEREEHRKEVLARMAQGWTDPEHPERPQEKVPVSPDEAKDIARFIKQMDDQIEFYKRMIAQAEERIREKEREIERWSP